MSSLAVVLALLTVVAVGIVYLFTDSFLFSLLVLAVGLALAFYLDKKWRLDDARSKMKELDTRDRQRILKDLAGLKKYQLDIGVKHRGAMSAAVDNIYDVSHHLLHDEEIDLKFVHQVGLYLPRINQILDTYLQRSADAAFKNQSQDFMIRTSEVFSRLLTASGNQDMKEAESLMQALEETYRSHGHLNREDRGDLS